MHQILGVTCDNASANDAMIDSLAIIISDFAGEANHVQCLPHIINLVVKIILCQFDVSKKKKGRDRPEANDEEDGPGHEITEDEDEELVRVLDKEEKEMDSDDETDEDNERLGRDVEMIEEVMEDEIMEVSMMVKPVHQVLFKVGTFHLASISTLI